ncbi:MAG: D-cysteine desulfhydrase family protein [Clostridia bacterium]|nr:D-cysteine desulfhydrase family protein [Clostridia bacterium]
MNHLGQPWVDLGIPTTPLEEEPHLSRALGGPRVFFKRDDLTGVGFGGNKLRKLEYLLGDALSRGADTVITTAAVQSNFLRITAAACRRLGLNPVFFVRAKANEELTGNALCYQLAGAEVHAVNTADPYSESTIQAMTEYAADLERRGHTPYLIHLGTFSGPLATVGYIDGTRELIAQARSEQVVFDHAFVAVGSGGTMAGMLLAFADAQMPCTVTGVSVCEPASNLTDRIYDFTERAAQLVDLEVRVPRESVRVTDSFIGAGHGIPSPESLEAVKLVARTEGIFLDPIYTGKAMAALMAAVRKGEIQRGANVLFVHTGGAPNLFRHADAFRNMLDRSEIDGSDRG